jgi:hypothetical protein
MSVFAQSKANRRVISRIAAVSLGALLFSGVTALVTPGPALANGCPAPVAPSGNGSTADPYIIDSAAKLAWISQADGVDRVDTSDSNSPFPQHLNRLDKHYAQEGLIDLTGCNWTPIGFVWTTGGQASFDGPFSGTYDGRGNEIKGLSVVTGGLLIQAGLFGAVGSGSSAAPATVKNLRIVGATVESTVTAGSTLEPTGILAGIIGISDGFTHPHALVDKVHVSGSVSKPTTGNGVGGLVGRAEGNALIKDSSSTATVSRILSGNSTGGRYTGGLIGDLGSSATVLRSFATGSVITGNVDQGEGRTGDYIGGLVGRNSGKIFYSYAQGDVTGSGWIGGLVGSLDNDLQEIKDSYSLGNVVAGGTGGIRGGGFVGEVRWTPAASILERNYSSGSVSVPRASIVDNVGAFGGSPPLDFDPPVPLASLTQVKDNFFDSSKDVPTLAIALTTNPEAASRVATGRSTLELNSFATFDTDGWAIVDGWAPFKAPEDGNVVQGAHQVWGICSGVNGGYPFLLWQYTSNPCNSSSPGPSAAPGVVSPAIHLDLKAKAGDVVAGAPVLIEGQGLKPGSTYSLVMRSTPTTVTTGTVSSGGRFSTTVNLPSGIAPGNHTITLTAIGSDGSTLSLVTTFVVSSAGTFTSISPGVGSVVGGLAATGPNSSALSLGVASSLALLALGLAVFASSRRKAARVS